VPPSKIQKIAAAAQDLIDASRGTRQSLLSLLGRLGYAAVACPFVIFFRASLLGSVGSGPLDETIHLNQATLDELQFWSSPEASAMLSKQWEWKRFCSHRVFAKHGSPRELPSLTLWGDASEFGAGYNSSRELGLPVSELLPPEFAGNSVPSTVRELYVIVRLVELSLVPAGSCIRLISDNQGAVATANGSAVCASTAPLARRLVHSLLSRDIRLQVEWAPREMLDDVDQRSRLDARDLAHAMCTTADYASIFGWAFRDGRPDVQLFSCASSAIPGIRQCTRFPEPDSLGCPFMLRWCTAGRLWAFPPFCLARPFMRRLLIETYSDHDRTLQICALLPDNATVRAAISALPRGWRVRPGPSRLLPPPTFLASISSSVQLLIVASPA
jgi:hypothetical protein